jgi:hypothetical protein
VTTTWWRRRLGILGDGRDRIVAALSRRLGAGPAGGAGGDTGPGRSAGFAPAALEDLAARYGARGDARRLTEIAAWGAEICGLTADPPGDDRAPGAAARFNLAVALFDSLVDDRCASLPAVARVLHPDRLTGWLERPDDTMPRPVDGSGGAVAALFEQAVRDAGRCWRSHARHRTLLAGLLASMYRSELGLSADPFAAKELPVVFLGALGTADPGALAMHRRLGRFIAAWDDWLDQDEDLVARRPNLFYGDPRGLGVVSYSGRAVLRTLGSRRTVRATRDELVARLDAVLVAAEAVGEPVATRTGALLGRLVA